MGKPKVVVAMSGGVDSSVAAALLARAGYEVIGITMRLWTEERDDLPATNRTCCGVEAVEDAQAVAQAIEIPYYLLNFERPFATHVVDYFTREYAHGRTPNPCQACNQHVKFDYLMERAVALGADHLATGHYARVERRAGAYRLLRGTDGSKDQSYFLYSLGQEELSRTLFPVGGYTKEEIRAIARDLDLPVAGKSDSQEICFIPDNDYRRFLDERITPAPGELVDTQGFVIGRHRGIAHYTIGQRHGLGLASPHRLYVTRIEPEENRVVVGPEEDLYAREALIDEVSFVAEEALPLDVGVKIRYRSREAAATVYEGQGGMRVMFQEPQRAMTPGQAAVFYRGNEVVGGGRLAAVMQ